ncbi:nuclear transport factor 2 family protein [Seonamhaeicola sp.]|uniref:nuclear transport factor 2 family protein n=1 Tax=Seonamhaeicola sp. TaxID=1912245 RepID=UPI00261D8DB6|nr:nuclear transport factor 2 family protein [Seonamhaeicola sp.]
MTTQQLVNKWFDVWERGDFENIPVSDNFSHTSPFGTISGKKAYLALVSLNKEQFLGHDFIIHDIISENNKACVRYTAVKGDFRLDVSEWHYCNNNLIEKIIAHYHIGEIREDKQLNM